MHVAPRRGPKIVKFERSVSTGVCAEKRSLSYCTPNLSPIETKLQYYTSILCCLLLPPSSLSDMHILEVSHYHVFGLVAPSRVTVFTSDFATGSDSFAVSLRRPGYDRVEIFRRMTLQRDIDTTFGLLIPFDRVVPGTSGVVICPHVSM